jgi:CubicO group peptidase (beta-lactamase class C family)
MKRLLVIFLFFIASKCPAQSLYFPPLLGDTWDTLSPASLGWCTERVDSLYDFLQQQNSKAFIVLKDGKIVLEKYFGSFTQDSLWYWASAGKTITSFLVGKAQEDGFLSINDTSSKYLGVGWTNCTAAQENEIRIRNQLTMTSGLDDGVPDNYCTLDTCLEYLAPAGSRWAYHNAPYTLLEQVLAAATGQGINAYTLSALRLKTGITGTWLTVGYNNVFYSKPRSMARFGLLVQNNCIWRNDTLLHDTGYVHDMINTSQQLNYGYGYLWWLNGKGSYRVPGSQFVFPGSYAPAAPMDMYAAIGKNGQIVSIAPSKGLVVVRMGNADEGEVPFLLCNSIWERLNYVMCNATPATTYTFTGVGNWNIAANWSNNAIPPAVLPAGDQIVIYPFAGGECVLNVSQTIPSRSSLVVVSGKRFRIQGNLVVE